MAEADETSTEPAPEASAPPVHPDIVAMEEALDRGDHARTRELAESLCATDDPKLKATGEAMLARLRPDPVILGVMFATGAILVALALGYLGPR